jgi:hypothetical protein
MRHSHYQSDGPRRSRGSEVNEGVHKRCIGPGKADQDQEQDARGPVMPKLGGSHLVGTFVHSYMARNPCLRWFWFGLVVESYHKAGVSRRHASPIGRTRYAKLLDPLITRWRNAAVEKDRC